jgi:uncharacterized membrane protein YbhN (UPF0104 family)
MAVTEKRAYIMKKKIFNVIQYLFFLGLGIFLLWWRYDKLTELQKQQLFDSLTSARYVLILPAMAMLLLSHYSRALRWKLLMAPLGYRPSTINTFFAVMIGYLFNLLFPRLGEVMKCTTLGKYEKLAADKLVGTIIAERAFDFLCLIIVFAITILIQINKIGAYATAKLKSLFHDSEGNFKIRTLLILLGVLLFLILLVRFLYRRHIKSNLLIRINAILQSVWAGLTSFRYIRNKALFIGHTVFIWFMYLMSVRVGFYAMDSVSQLGIKPSFSILTFGSLAMIPTPGGIGTYQATIQELMPLYGIDEVYGYGYGWLLWIAQTLIVIVAGFLCLALLPLINRKHHALPPAHSE